MNLTLIGMAGAGKSYLGKRLAKKLALEFIDSDDRLAEKFGKPIQEILDELGEKKYVETEAALNIEHTMNRDDALISPSGSSIYSERWMDHLKDISIVVYLRVPYEMIEERLRDKPPRAIIGLGRKTLHELYDERHPLYEMHADISVDTASRDLKEVEREILDFLAAHGSKRSP